MTNMLENAQVSRRTFMKGSALAGLGAAAMGTGAVSLFGCSPSADGAKGNDAATQAVEETTTWGHCAINCPGRCSLKFHVQDDEVAWVETYTSKDAGFDEVQPRACLRGRTYRRWLANPDRINYPMKRVGKRGEGKFEQISWDEAVDTIASELKRIIDEYGNESVYIPYATGVSSTTARSLPRFMNCLGGFLGSYGDYSAMQMEMIVPHTYGASQLAHHEHRCRDRRAHPRVRHEPDRDAPGRRRVALRLGASARDHEGQDDLHRPPHERFRHGPVRRVAAHQPRHRRRALLRHRA